MNDSRVVSGAGNRFLVTDAWTSTLEEALADGSRLARQHAAQVDGVLSLLPSESAAFRMLVHNSDGSRARMCGNGLRCAVHVARLTGHVTGDGEWQVETDSGRLGARWLGEGRVECEVSVPCFEPDRIPAATAPRIALGDLGIVLAAEPVAYVVGVGGAHLVLFTRDLEAVELEHLGPQLEHHTSFPDRANVHFARRVEGGYAIRTWERGAGATAACGTGAAAVAIAGADLAPTRARVSSSGGMLEVAWDGPGHAVRVTGPVEG